MQKISKRFQKKHKLKLWAGYAFGGVNKNNMSFEWYLENCTFGYIPRKRIQDLKKDL